MMTDVVTNCDTAAVSYPACFFGYDYQQAVDLQNNER